MEIIFTRHAIERIEERNILLKELMACLARPDKKREEAGKSIYLKISKSKNNLLILVCKEEKDSCTIITAFKTSKIKKYL